MQWKTHESTRESPGTPNVNWRQPGCNRQWVRPKTSNQEYGRHPSAKLRFLQGKFIPKEIQKHALVNRFLRFIADRVYFLGTDLLLPFLSFSIFYFLHHFLYAFLSIPLLPPPPFFSPFSAPSPFPILHYSSLTTGACSLGREVRILSLWRTNIGQQWLYIYTLYCPNPTLLLSLFQVKHFRGGWTRDGDPFCV